MAAETAATLVFCGVGSLGISQPGGEFGEAGLDGCRWVIAEFFAGFCYIGVGSFDVGWLLSLILRNVCL